MKSSTKEKLRIAQKFCDDNDKSTEFMLQYMQDVAGVSFETVMDYLTTSGGFEEQK